MLTRSLPLPPRSRVAAVLLTVSALLANPAAVPAQDKANDHYGLVILNDGFVLQGKVIRESTVTETDSVTGTPYSYPKGFFLVDDGPRRIVFSHKQVRLVTKMDPPIDDRVDNPVKPVLGPKMPTVAEVVDEGAWDNRLERTFTFRAVPGGPQSKLKQKLDLATPYFVRLDSTTDWAWGSVYLTRELKPDVVQAMLGGHPAFQEKEGMSNADRTARRFRYADFFTRTGWYPEAEVELQRILKDFPDQKERVTERQTAIGKLRARESFEEIKRLHNGGQYDTVVKRIADFPAENVPEDTLAAFRELKSEYEGAKERREQAVRFLTDLKVEDKFRPLFAEAAKAIKDELAHDNLARLETFLSQAKQAEKRAKAGKKPELNPSELMALAVTGWLLGNGAAEANPLIAAKLWRTRHLLVDYLHTTGAGTRQKLLADYLAERNDSTALDDITRIVPTLPPVEPETEITTKTVTVKLGRAQKGVTYDLRLPPEYRHSRAYPVLILLHKEGDKPADTIDKWKEQAAENGYILAAPEWDKAGIGGYTYGDNDEHQTVLETLRDLRRRFQVDSDRIFVFGQGQGANMAHDVGLSHPDLFAGVSSMGVDPTYHAMAYWRSGQYLPFYVVTGTNSGKSEEHVHDLFDHWVGRHYPMLWVAYKGRGADWFGGELPNIFDWMRAKKRAFPLHQLGTDGLGEPFGNEFYAVRPSDNRFYWLTSDNIDINRCILKLSQWRKLEAARVTATIDSTKNEVKVSSQGLKQITVWLGRNARGENMIDFDRDVVVRVNMLAPVKKKLTPSATVLLEDLYDRGDRQRLFLGKIEIGQ